MSFREFPVFTKSIAFVGMMGAGKSAIGRRTAERLKLQFVDADDETRMRPDAVSRIFLSCMENRHFVTVSAA